MTAERYREAYELVKADYESADARVERAERELAEAITNREDVRRALAALATLCGELANDEPLGLTDAIREVFNQSGESLTSAEVRGRLEISRFNLKTQKNPDASIATVIKRLEEAGEVRRTRKTLKHDDRRYVTRLAWAGKNVTDEAERNTA